MSRVALESLTGSQAALCPMLAPKIFGYVQGFFN